MTSTANVPRVSVNQSIDDRNDLVAHGTVYDDVKYPYVIMVRGIAHTCTGSLIQPLFVLTAAHCSWQMAAKDMKVYRGHVSKSWRNPDLKRDVQVIHQHEGYTPSTQTPDISLLEVYSRITTKRMTSEWKGFDSFAVIGGTPEEFANDRTINCVVIGFGQRELQQVAKSDGYQTEVVTGHGPNACAQPWAIDGWQKFLCAQPNKQMVCQGDSGGPMICNDKLYGSVKDGYNYKYNNDTVCGDPDVQTRHIFLYYYREWIDNQINGDSYDDYYDNTPTNRQYFTIVAFFAILSLSGQVVFYSI
ncbi:trypsin epsilon-like [Adelges cooleyi]|uniref:trypsin epsilon-like n=1 Tax=Adelges cooleyi TaxID=133065 RepID=UPI0021807152|nr:trypsin epsilon-like [Adelges cooleyi]